MHKANTTDVLEQQTCKALPAVCVPLTLSQVVNQNGIASTDLCSSACKPCIATSKPDQAILGQLVQRVRGHSLHESLESHPNSLPALAAGIPSQTLDQRQEEDFTPIIHQLFRELAYDDLQQSHHCTSASAFPHPAMKL